MPSVSLVLVISSLVYVMVDQVSSLRRSGVRPAILLSGNCGMEKELVASDEDMPSCSLLFCAPEILASIEWRDTLTLPAVSKRVVAVVIDEAHCVSKWSKDFRPSYGRLHEFRALLLSGIPFIACTATATRSIRQEVVSNLNMGGCESSPDRHNKVFPCTSIKNDMQHILDDQKKLNCQAPCTLIYCRLLNTCSDLYAHFH